MLKWVVAVAGFLLVLWGAYWGVTGYSVVDLERGWSAVIAGAVVFSTGVIALSIAALMSSVESIARATRALQGELAGNGLRAQPQPQASHVVPAAPQPSVPSPQEPLPPVDAAEDVQVPPASPDLPAVPVGGLAAAATMAAAGAVHAAPEVGQIQAVEESSPKADAPSPQPTREVAAVEPVSAPPPPRASLPELVPDNTFSAVAYAMPDFTAPLAQAETEVEAEVAVGVANAAEPALAAPARPTLPVPSMTPASAPSEDWPDAPLTMSPPETSRPGPPRLPRGPISLPPMPAGMVSSREDVQSEAAPVADEPRPSSAASTIPPAPRAPFAPPAPPAPPQPKPPQPKPPSTITGRITRVVRAVTPSRQPVEAKIQLASPPAPSAPTPIAPTPSAPEVHAAEAKISDLPMDALPPPPAVAAEAPPPDTATSSPAAQRAWVGELFKELDTLSGEPPPPASPPAAAPAVTETESDVAKAEAAKAEAARAELAEQAALDFEPTLDFQSVPRPEHEMDSTRSTQDSAGHGDARSGTVPAAGTSDDVATSAPPAHAREPAPAEGASPMQETPQVSQEDSPQHVVHDNSSPPQDEVPPPLPERVLVRSYESQGVQYHLYEDGSIDAETTAGTFRFASLDELRDFIQKRTG